MSEEPKKSWWAKLFESAPSAPADKPPSYEELRDRVRVLEADLLKSKASHLDFRARTRGVVREYSETEYRLRNALAWYADPANWRPYSVSQLVRAHDDKGAKARAALGRS